MPRRSTLAGSGIPADTRPQRSNGPGLASSPSGGKDVKARKAGGYVALALAYAYACGGSPAPSSSPSTTDDGGPVESGGGDDGSDLERKGDARAGDAGHDASRLSDGGAHAGAGDDSTTSPSSSSSQYCCMAGAYYACLTDAALSQCSGSAAPSGCTRNPAYDSVCITVDGGGTTSTSTTTSSGTSNVQPPTPVRNSCGGLFPGNLACGTGGTCIGGEHCTGGSCYPSDVGNPCTYDNECGQGNHCTSGCCQSPAKGSPCTAFWDCKSNNCSGGVCQ
ncbi:MAG TPA: hypothetical protein VMI75_37560 [Polyangiaceae bacterium]|nr:hypothetical protein [Polyangiaceae bacterium]